MYKLIVVLAADLRSGRLIVEKFKNVIETSNKIIAINATHTHDVIDKLRGCEIDIVVVQERLYLNDEIRKFILTRRPKLWLNEEAVQ